MKTAREGVRCSSIRFRTGAWFRQLRRTCTRPWSMRRMLESGSRAQWPACWVSAFLVVCRGSLRHLRYLCGAPQCQLRWHGSPNRSRGSPLCCLRSPRHCPRFRPLPIQLSWWASGGWHGWPQLRQSDQSRYRLDGHSTRHRWLVHWYPSHWRHIRSFLGQLVQRIHCRSLVRIIELVDCMLDRPGLKRRQR